jgi:mRNA interferase MazF
LDQPANPEVSAPSLISQTGCLIVVDTFRPLTDDSALVIPDLSVTITPSEENGCNKAWWAASHLVATMSKARIQATSCHITPEQLAAIRRQIALSVGFEK